MRIGIGFDAHRFEKGRELVLCGVAIPYEMGLLGHSDADCPLHALIDAMFGAAAMGDIGMHFPDSDAAYKGISSLLLLKMANDKLKEKDFCVNNCDITIIAQKPKLAPYIDKMRKNIAEVLGISLDRVSVKATTTEGLGFTGRQEGIACMAVASIREID
ncbi:2-C-methyl-D-erythritol 2,4-cyclodiphosphate synthase [Caldanaerobius fijiensis DSM 17918]|uniref:2-C-methyl-D-erythritol 2,4-cyclodiphosphate synthase n=1 Tax=Caldanaerobius fijiensis DSM 17918 TaxID=1121256 RepID=A0A1M5BX91_9THEO|nr:2-C-methyl-D-erythritol 2,4-cyclodiphosphate synthase [Caldanaerobius fijiensis]SHF47144.1 2-C-methyl-D-erythritol 2,4-cyclodiphosphate synthase [Caldanaerobius fijiensis DSM 17918]